MIPDQFIQELRYRNDLESVMSSYMELKRRGRNLVGLCPFHSEKTPSLTVYPENQSFYCFGCGVGGDVITFIRKIENLDYIEALRFLAARGGIGRTPADAVVGGVAAEQLSEAAAEQSMNSSFSPIAFLFPEGGLNDTLIPFASRGCSQNVVCGFTAQAINIGKTNFDPLFSRQIYTS